MGNKVSRHISENELDGLLNEAFLNLDFETRQNREVLEIVGNCKMRKSFLSGFFNPYRLNLLLLILSVFIFLNSFYRYLEPILNKDDKKYEPVLGISPAYKHKQPEVTKEDAKNRNFLERKTRSISTENKTTPEHTRGGTVIKPIIPGKMEKADSIFLNSLARLELDTIRVSSQPENDSTDLTQKSNPATAVAANKKIRTERKISPKVTTKRGKTPRMGKGAKFRKNGTFIMKGGRYGKSRKIQR